MLKSRRGESDLVYRAGKFYLLATVEVEEPLPGTPEEWLGVDLGVTNIASDSDGEIHTSEQVQKSRKRYERIRAKLQAAGTKSAKRHLKIGSGWYRKPTQRAEESASKISQASASGVPLGDRRDRGTANGRLPNSGTLSSTSLVLAGLP